MAVEVWFTVTRDSMEPLCWLKPLGGGRDDFSRACGIAAPVLEVPGMKFRGRRHGLHLRCPKCNMLLQQAKRASRIANRRKRG